LLLLPLFLLQREVENKLSLVIKKLADVKYTERKQKSQKKELCFEEQAAEVGDERLPTCTAQTSQVCLNALL